MKCGFLIRLSGNKISFLYNKSDKNGLFPFDGNRPVLPLAILRKEDDLVIGETALQAHQTGSADAFIDVFRDAKRPGTFSLNGKDHAYGELLLLAVEKHISDFMQQAYLLQGKTYDELKNELPLGFIFNDCVSMADQENVLSVFENHGYANVARIDFNTYLFNNFRTQHVLVVSGDGHDIMLRLYDRESRKVKEQRLLPGAGADPRVKAVAEFFFNNLTPAGASKEKAMPKLELEAMYVLEHNPAEHQNAIDIDGIRFEFFATRREIETASANIAGQTENLGIAEFLHHAGVDMSGCSMIVSPTLAANSYFRNELKSSFPEIKLVDEKIEKEVFNIIDKTMREGGFQMHVFANADNDMESAGPLKTNVKDGVVILDNKMSKQYIKGELHSTYILFRITVPKDARYVEIYRRDSKAPKEQEQLITRIAPTYDEIEENGKEKRVIVATEYADTGLGELTSYKYNFIAVYFDEYGQESHTADQELDYRTIPEVVTIEKPVKVILTNDDDNSALFKWTLPNRANLKLYIDDDPYVQKANDAIDSEIDIKGTQLPVDDTKQQYILRKDFHGIRYILPVTVRNGRMMAGEVVTIESNPQPTNVKAAYMPAADAIRVEWDWKQLKAVQVVWQYKDDNPVVVDVPRTGDEGRVDVAQHPQKSAVSIEVRSVFTKDDGTPVIGTPVKKVVNNIPPAQVELQEISDEGRNKYSYTLATVGDVPVPCDLRLLIKEGNTNFDSPDQRIDIKRAQWVKGQAVKQFDYRRKNPADDLNFRLVLADEAFAERLYFVAQEKGLEGNREAVTDSTATTGGNPPPPPPNWVRILIILLVIAAGAFLAWKFLGNKTEEAPKEVLYNEIKFSTAKEELTLNEPKIVELQVTPITADEEIIWTSNSDRIELSPNGKTSIAVKPVKVGNATITAKSSKSNQEANLFIVVKKTSKTGGDKTGGDKTGGNTGGGTKIAPGVFIDTTKVNPIPPEPRILPSTVIVKFTTETELIAHIYLDDQEVGTGSWSGKLDKGTTHTVKVALQKPGKKKLKEIKQTWNFEAPAKLTVPIDPKPFE